MEWSLDGSLSELYPLDFVGPSKMAVVSGHSFNIVPNGKNIEKSACLKQHDKWGLNFDGMVLGWSYPLQNCIRWTRRSIQDGCHQRT